MFEQYDWLEYDDELPTDYETLCFELMPNINTYTDMEEFCWLQGIDRSSWFSIYKGLLTVVHFGSDCLERENHAKVDSIIEAQTKENASLKTIAMHKLTLVEHADDVIEVYDKNYYKLGNVIKIAGMWLNDRFDDFPDKYRAACSYVRPIYQEFGW